MPASSLLISAASEQFHPAADKQSRACKSGATRALGALQRDVEEPGQGRHFFGTGEATAQNFAERAKKQSGDIEIFHLHSIQSTVLYLEHGSDS